ncbi:MAG: sugar phosphate isomerase/epimerase family protein [Desulfobacterales bacterium]|jgi:sugar phosphate isomerase/epimerase
MKNLLSRVQVNVPFSMLWDRYAENFLSRGLNPEIGIDAAALDRFSSADFGEMAARIKDRGLTITLHGPFSDLSAGSIDPQIRAVTRHRFEQLLEAATLFSPKTVVCHAGYDWKRYAYLLEEWLQKSVDMWRWLAQRLKLLGCRLMLENVYENGPEELLPLFEDLAPQGVGFCLDTGHQSAFSRSSLGTWLDVLGPFLGQLHLHDNHGRRDDHLAMGQGTIDFQYLFKRLKDLNDSPPVITLEPHTKEALDPSLAHLKAIWPWQ